MSGMRILAACCCFAILCLPRPSAAAMEEGLGVPVTARMMFMPEEETERVPGAYGANYVRLAALKAKYDPGNLFRLNQNVQPKA